MARDQLDVALACNGLKMLMSLAATVTATIMLLPLIPAHQMEADRPAAFPRCRSP